ncbi:cellobiose phosphorylase [Aminivibrio pyruvatiphilus]|uniref:Cellobiose phosphorylase n=1 Tax=Aminivibrio pyruvatiphilus TaxID=1005740 RepID=A0A4R8MLF4_9BACT|nr:glucoamylase family protein [Aminivibrio pyruvatiphilus]TDY64906.1 cellobiose phosphorylase [Aminivibrio pyruvatiphilus]
MDSKSLWKKILSFMSLRRLRSTYMSGAEDSAVYNSRGKQFFGRAQEVSFGTELFSADQMEQHGKILARRHRVQSGHPRDSLLPLLDGNEKLLREAYGQMEDDAEAGRRIVPAGEWLLDNFHLIEEQIRTARRHLPKGYSRELPYLTGDSAEEFPRVYDIARETISHCDGRVDPENLVRFVKSYLSVTTLKLGELWAIPIMLRLALIENLRQVADRLIAARAYRNLAEFWADRMIHVASEDPKNLILPIADMARSNPPMDASFVAELTRRLQGQGTALTLPLTWMEQQLSENGLTIEQCVRSENQRQTVDQASIRNSIGSLRFLGAMDWRKFVETMSIVEQTLEEDPAGIYRRMDFTTRDRYRHVVARIAKNSPCSEIDVARKAIQLAREGAAERGDGDRTAHVGFYLIDEGTARLERESGGRFSLAFGAAGLCRRCPLALYLVSILLLTAVLSGGLVAKTLLDGTATGAAILLGLLSFLCAGHLSIALANWLATLMASPRLLPRMDLSGGIPAELLTLAVTPTMFSSVSGVEELVAAMEVRFLANRDDHLLFGLLTDFPDAAEKTLPEDAFLLKTARERIEALNEKYRRAERDIFFLFHRPRRWNPQEGVWMGYERKRGKLAALNAFLRGGGEDAFALVVGEISGLSGVKYVITLDTDTQLPRDSARQFVGVMAHPLNRARYDEERRRVTAGYGILQPRVAVSIIGTNRSRYARLWTSELGIDPYTRAVSDVYQDLFGEGSFIGKGIYDIDAFELALRGRFPENRILSHDLLEGCYARAGLLSDVQLYEEYPSRYQADVSRRHRWIRGDWQIAQWCLPRVPEADGRLRKNPLSMLSRWKIFDNLRRSLMAPALMLLLAAGWFLSPSPLFWTLAAAGVILIPSFISSALNLFSKPNDVAPRQHFAAALDSAARGLARDAFTFICLPYEAFFSMDAIMLTLVRMAVTKKTMLEWNPSGGPERAGHADLREAYRTMWSAPVTAVIVCLAIPSAGVGALFFAAGPVLALWCVSPAVAWWTSRPLTRRRMLPTEEQRVFLRRIARKTWSFFETFIGREDNWLPPDNYQEHPVEVIAHRTSPTNMGVALLANMSAFDFGYISAGRFLELTGRTLRTMEGLERYRGHFYNWYDTRTLKPLTPLYVSTVDSGNLAGYLLTLQRGVLALADHSIFDPRFFEGLNDTLGIIAGAQALFSGSTQPSWLSRLRMDMESALSSGAAAPEALRLALERLEESASAAAAAESNDRDAGNNLKGWLQTFARQCRDGIDELTFLVPWAVNSSSGYIFENLPDPGSFPTLRELALLEKKILPSIELRRAACPPEERDGLDTLAGLLAESGKRARKRIEDTEEIANLCDELARMEYGFLYDETRHLLAIGYNVDERRPDAGYYDLLASEARFATFVAISQGRLPQESWFALGRRLTAAGGIPMLLSWSGSMFEYLMPLLVMPTYEHTLLDETYNAVVAMQIKYGEMRTVPWGISESGYNAFDVHLNYQYRAFGVPGLGIQRGLAEDLVIAPYASMLALMVAPEEACSNLERLSAEGFESWFGFYEAIDYTPSRLHRNQPHATVRSFMTHHQGMGLLSLANLLLDRSIQRRFESSPLFQATLLLLQEQIPKATAFFVDAIEHFESRTVSGVPETSIRIFRTPDTPNPEVQLLSNGRYHVAVTASGGGYSRWKELAVTRWREDPTRDNWGAFCYIRDTASGDFWSNTYQPTLKSPEQYEAIFSEGRAEFRVRDHEYDIYTEIAVSTEDDIELRRIRITNRARTRREVEVTSYAEVVLAPPAADALHPAFSNLFVQTEILRRERAILCTRRPRVDGEDPPWMLHMMTVRGASVGEASYETDRMKFIGYGNSVENPQALERSGGAGPAPLSDSEGSVLDPIVSIRCRITLAPEESVTVNIVSGIGETRKQAMDMIGKYQDRRLADRVFDLAWTHGQVLLRQINVSEADAQLYSRIAGSILYANAALRAEQNLLVKNRRGQSGLWGYAISGDLPIVLLRITDPANIDLVRQLVQAHAYWRLKGLAVDLVIWNEDRAGYRQLLHDSIVGIVSSVVEARFTDRPGGIFVRIAEQIAEEDRILFQTVARVIVSDTRGTLEEQTGGRTSGNVSVPLFVPVHPPLPEQLPSAPSPRNDLMFCNGLGGFTPDGREYVITTARGLRTPAPWVNVLANPDFGSVVTENGSAYTWSENAHEFRITPWGNDPVSASGGEAFYLRDEERGHYWSPAPFPCRGATPYVARHGFGYTVFEHTERDIRSELWMYVALDAPVKFFVLRVHNLSERSRRLSATGFIEWVLGDLRPKSSMHVITEVEPNSGALFARNPYNTEFPGRTAFFDVDEPMRSVCGNRTEFLGRNGTAGAPAAMKRAGLSGRTGAALDPCAAIQVRFDLAAGQEHEIVFRLGACKDADEAARLVALFKGPSAAREALDAVWQHWTHTLGAINAETPDRSLDVLVNGWLLYQTLACRMWARSATYQSGGAFGFRDQLQDSMALVHAKPGLVRDHLLLCASRQFPEGDVQHWWHPPTGRGVRTRCSDDYLWLPLAASRYVVVTGDFGVLDEAVRFLQGRPLNKEEESYYDLPGYSEETASLYRHCVLAIEKGLSFGERGLPLMGSGDWNDGMDKVGLQGMGESVWLGFFLYEVLSRFAGVARAYGDALFAERCEQEAFVLCLNIEKSGWDGEWYRRAYFDDGSPLGSAENSECRIDSISQSWSVLSGAGDHDRTVQAMESVDTHLVSREDRLVKLLDPPFDRSEPNPGYIRGYVPGVRENGGQYTHAAVWASMAFARLGDAPRAWEVFSMINPVNHGRTPEEVDIYKVEPYVVAADVYVAPQHLGRGGWTWYTGSAAWMYRLIVESLLGLVVEANTLRFIPCLPPEWEGCTIHYRYMDTVYNIRMLQNAGAPQGTASSPLGTPPPETMGMTVDGAEQSGGIVPLVNDLREHEVEVRFSVARGSNAAGREIQ